MTLLMNTYNFRTQYTLPLNAQDEETNADYLLTLRIIRRWGGSQYLPE